MASAIGLEPSAEAKASILSVFPTAVEETAFIADIANQLEAHGIKKGNCIALVSSCRDEASRIVDDVISEQFGYIFNMHGLAGVPPGGKLAVMAGTHHSPIEGGKERYVFFGITHIGIDEKGAVGSMRRLGREAPSGACGALLYLTGEFAKKSEAAAAPEDDNVEVFYLRKQVEAKSPAADVASVTKATLEVINETFEDLIAKVVHADHADYALITGIQIHSGANTYGEEYTYKKVSEYFVPSLAYAVIGGEKKELKI